MWDGPSAIMWDGPYATMWDGPFAQMRYGPDCPDVVWNTCSPQGIIKDIWQKALEQKSEIGAKEWRLTMAKVLKLATFPVARKRESKRAKQGELMVLPVATPAAPRRLKRATSLFTVETYKIVKEMVEQSDQIT